MMEQHNNENQSYNEDDQSCSSDEDESISDNDYETNDICPTSKAPRNEITQHVLAIIFAGLAAVATHAQIHGGYDAWKNELHKDWLAICSSFTMASSSSTDITNGPKENKEERSILFKNIECSYCSRSGPTSRSF